MKTPLRMKLSDKQQALLIALAQNSSPRYEGGSISAFRRLIRKGLVAWKNDIGKNTCQLIPTEDGVEIAKLLLQGEPVAA